MGSASTAVAAAVSPAAAGCASCSSAAALACCDKPGVGPLPSAAGLGCSSACHGAESLQFGVERGQSWQRRAERCRRPAAAASRPWPRRAGASCCRDSSAVLHSPAVAMKRTPSAAWHTTISKPLCAGAPAAIPARCQPLRSSHLLLAAQEGSSGQGRALGRHGGACWRPCTAPVPSLP